MRINFLKIFFCCKFFVLSICFVYWIQFSICYAKMFIFSCFSYILFGAFCQLSHLVNLKLNNLLYAQV